MASRQRPRWATLMPNSTCDFASLLASANDGDADITAAHAARTTSGIFMLLVAATISFRTRQSKACAMDGIEKRGRFARRPVNRLRISRALSSARRRYNRCPRSGPCDVRQRLDLFSFRSRPARTCAMTDLLDLAALSLLPPWCGVRIAERLRGG